jgi:uncharacterized membrane protein HdeD (DUF308 family)
MTQENPSTRAGPFLQRAWWVLALRGLLAIVIGIAMVTRPGRTLSVVLATLGVYLLLDGGLALAATLQAARGKHRWWPYLMEGLVSIGVGLLALARPSGMALAIVVVIAARAIITGIVEIATGRSVGRTARASGWILGLSGIASLAFGVLLFANPGVGLLTLVWMAGMYGVVFGLLMAGEAFQLRSLEGSRFATASGRGSP